MARAMQVRKVQVANTDDTSELYDAFWLAAQKVGVTKRCDWPKDFKGKFGGREQFLKKQGEKQQKEEAMA